MSTKVIFSPAEVSFLWRKSVFRDVCMLSCEALRFLVILRPPIHETFAFSFKHETEIGWHADVSEDKLPLEQRLSFVLK